MNGGLRREIGLFAVTASGVGMILGAGIYALIGNAAGVTGNSVWIAFLFGALISSFTGLSYAELSSMMPRAAAEVSYVNEASEGDLAPFLTGWIIIFTEIVTISTVALGFGGYFSGLFGIPPVVAAAFLVILLSGMNFVGIKESSKVTIIFTIIEASGLLLIVILGIPHLGTVNYLEASQGFQGILQASTLIFFAYLGFQDIVNLAEETKKPERNIPKALILSVLLTTIVYVMVAITVVSLVDWQELSASCCPLALAASKSLLGQNASFTLSVIALFATANTVLVLLIVSSRMIYGMARDGFLPQSLSKLSRRGTPWIAILAVMILPCLVVIVGNIGLVAEITNLGTFIIFATVNLSAIWLRFKKPEWKRPFKTPITIARIPLVPFLGLLSCGLMITQFRIEIVILCLAIISLGVLSWKLLSNLHTRG